MLRKDEARLEWNDSWGWRGAPVAHCLCPAKAQPLENVHIFRSSLGEGQVTGK